MPTHAQLAVYVDRLPSAALFTAAQAQDCGVPRHALRLLVAAGLVCHALRGLYVVSGLTLDVGARARGLALVVPPGSVVTDETAAWLHGVDLLDHRSGPPALHMFRLHGSTRLRRTAVDSGTRMLLDRDIAEVGGVLATTALRTAVDLARKQWPRQSIGAIDGLLRTGAFTLDELKGELPRFSGFRGIVRARSVVPLADAGAESPAESRLRWEWLQCADLPAPQLQIPVVHPFSSYPWFVDLGIEELKYGVEYDGAAFHQSSEQRASDRRKRDYLRDELGWTLDVFERRDVFGSAANPGAIIREGVTRARRSLSAVDAGWRWPTRAVS